jgi:predicted transcriptional regulator
VAGQRQRPRGQLEQAVLDTLWSADGAMTARQVLDAVPEPRPALTTVLTVLDRLGRKGAVEREQRSDAPLAFRATNRPRP